MRVTRAPKTDASAGVTDNPVKTQGMQHYPAGTRRQQVEPVRAARRREAMRAPPMPIPELS
jgi:hypothetical protein